MRWGAAALALLAVAGYVTLHEATGVHQARCTVAADGQQLVLEQQQAANAATIGAVAASRDLPERALAIALATSMQESGLRNITGGDRDSLGLFQQRPSQGWGTAAQIIDPVYAAGQFFDGLVKIPGYSRLPLTVAAQRVQHSGYPQAYAKHEADASLLAAALSGRRPGLACRVAPVRAAGDPAAVLRRLAREFGPQALAPYGADGSPVGGRTPAVRGRTVTVPADAAGRGAGTAGAQHGWVLAQWAVAQAPALRIEAVGYRGRLWRAADSAQGWTVHRGAAARAYGDVRITVGR